MKLYTEEQVRKLYQIAYTSGYGKYFTNFEEDVKKLTPIELPSDEEIEKYADDVMPDAEKIGGRTYSAYRGIKAGAKWMRDKILNK